MRGHLGLAPDDTCSNDLIAWCCCAGLAQCQEARELASRNLADNATYMSAGAGSSSGGNAGAV